MDEETRAAFEALHQQLGRRFDAVDRRLDGVDRRLDAVDQRLGTILDAVDQRLDAVDQRLDAVDQRLDAVDQRFGAVDQRVEGLDRRFDAVDRRLETVEQRLDDVDRRFDVMDRHFELVDQRFDGVDQRFESVEQRIGSEAEETRRQFGVVAESVRRDIKLLVDGSKSTGGRWGSSGKTCVPSSRPATPCSTRHSPRSAATSPAFGSDGGEGLVDPPVVRGQGGVRPPSPPSVITGAATGWTSATRPARVTRTASP